MDILTFENICFFHGTITLGRWENDPDNDTYKIENEDGTFYAVSNFSRYSDVVLPADYSDDKYMYIDGVFVRNPNYVDPEIQVLKEYLASTDYIYLKCMENCEDVNVVYADVVEQRKQARARIRELQG